MHSSEMRISELQKHKNYILGEYSDLNFDVGIVYSNASQHVVDVFVAVVGANDKEEHKENIFIKFV